MSENFFDSFNNESGEGQDLSYVVGLYEDACAEGKEDSLDLSEEEYLYLIEYLINSDDDDDNALKMCEIAFSRHPYSSEILVKYADALILAGEHQKAAQLLDCYKDSFCQNVDMSVLYARISICNGDFDTALTYVEQALSANGKSAELADAVIALAQDCMDTENYKEAVHFFMESDKIAPISYECYNDLAYCCERMNDLEKAIQYYNMYLDKDPFNDNVWFNLGTIFAGQGVFDKAIEAFEYSLVLNGSNSSSLYNLAIVYLNLERFVESAETFARFNACEEDNIAGLLGQANALLGLHDFAQARKLFRKVQKLDSECIEAKMGLEAMLAIEDYLDGLNDSFLLRIDNIVRTDVSWINTMRRLVPQLNDDWNFINYLKSIKK